MLPERSKQGNRERKAEIRTFGDGHLQEVRGSLKDKAKEKQSDRQEEIRTGHDRSQRQRQRR